MKTTPPSSTSSSAPAPSAPPSPSSWPTRATRCGCSPAPAADPSTTSSSVAAWTSRRPTASTSISRRALAVHHCAHGSAYDAKVWRAELPATEAVVLAAAGAHGRRRGLSREPLLLRAGRGPDDRGPPPQRHARQARHPRRAAARPRRLPHPDGQRGGLGLLRPARADGARGRAARPEGARGHDGQRRRQPRPAALVHLRPRPRPGDDHGGSHARAVEHASCTRRPPRPRRSGSWSRRSPRPPGCRPRGCGPCRPGCSRSPGCSPATPTSSPRPRTSSPRPFVLDSRSSEALLGLAPTPLDVAVKETVAWWRAAPVPTVRRTPA